MHIEFIATHPNWLSAFSVDGVVPNPGHTAFMDEHFGNGPCNLHFIHANAHNMPVEDPGMAGKPTATAEVATWDGEEDLLMAYSNGVYVVFREGLGANAAHYLFIKP
jgi:hypothetical protein